MKPEQVKELAAKVAILKLAKLYNISVADIVTRKLATEAVQECEQAEREAVGQPGEENWWSGAALDVMRHAKASNPPDWDNAIRSGLLSAYNRGQDAPRPEASTREALERFDYRGFATKALCTPGFNRGWIQEHYAAALDHVEAVMREAEKPKRIQRKRTRGWRMPANTVYVGRPTRWGNPWTPEKYWAAGFGGSIDVATKHCVEAYRAWLLGEKHWAHGQLSSIPAVSELRGKNLACWCSLTDACHADVLLEIANA